MLGPPYRGPRCYKMLASILIRAAHARHYNGCTHTYACMHAVFRWYYVVVPPHTIRGVLTPLIIKYFSFKKKSTQKKHGSGSCAYILPRTPGGI